ncbi:MAG: hypothetical protein J6R34_03335 [Clostridia bacterium]|nr:hypothetical protein [Clostridia bacterium]
MSDEIKTNDTVEEVAEEVTELDNEETVSQDDATEQVVEDAETAEPKKKAKKDAIFKINPKTGKKRLRGWLVTLITIVTIIAVGTASVFIALEALSSGGTDSTIADAPSTFGEGIAKNNNIYTTYEDLVAQFEDEIKAGMASDATDEEKVLAAWILYRIASMADYNAPEKAKYSTGGGRATGDLLIGESAISVGGGMNMTSTYYTILDAQGNKYVAQEEYTQVPAGTVEASSNGKPNNMFISAGEAALPAFLGFARRGIVTPDKTVTWAGANESSVISETGVIGEFANKEKQFNVLTAEEAAEKASAYERDYGANWGDAYGGTAPDLSIHVINLDTIIPDSVKITKELFSDYYTVAFDVDVNAIVGQGVDAEGNTFDIHATWYAEQLYLANAGLDFLNSLGNYSLRYSELKVNMTVFDNGYIRTWSTDETWIMSANITHDLVVKLFGSASATLTSKNESSEVYCYNHDTIMQGFVNRWIGGNENVGMPMSELPFADKLAGYEAQEYGTYR